MYDDCLVISKGSRHVSKVIVLTVNNQKQHERDRNCRVSAEPSSSEKCTVGSSPLRFLKQRILVALPSLYCTESTVANCKNRNSEGGNRLLQSC
mmetsp:Transcript_20319/g.50550  ORF Transcript_20319/g.50550 Transcript_20319/m.50550 type:complete len:94 (+) Transcript_20319:1564-1845(+)